MPPGIELYSRMLQAEVNKKFESKDNAIVQALARRRWASQVQVR